jgi:site-specific DNA-methyltransferase (adenine-specific)
MNTAAQTVASPWLRKETIGLATLYLADCFDVLPSLPRFAGVITDPPYGINIAAQPMKYQRAAGAQKRDWDASKEDRLPEALALGDVQVVWGGNYYGLPAASKWLVWDKINSGDFADCELAWTNLPGAVRMFRHMWNGMLRDSERGQRVHPTQKPVALMRWCLQQAGNPASVIDPCMGSSPVGVACSEVGIPYVGIERERRYFDTACERITNAQRQERLFA